MELDEDEFEFKWFIFDPAAVLRIHVIDRSSFERVGSMKISLQRIEVCIQRIYYVLIEKEHFHNNRYYYLNLNHIILYFSFHYL